MRYLAIIVVGVTTGALGACGGSDEQLTGRSGTGGSAGAAGFPTGTCTFDADCAGGQICEQNVCVSARSSGGAPLTAGGQTGSGGVVIIGAGGIQIGVGGVSGGTGGGAAGLAGAGSPGTGGGPSTDGGDGAAGSDSSTGSGGTPGDGSAGSPSTGGAATDSGRGNGGAGGNGGGGPTNGRVRCGTATCDADRICCFTPAVVGRGGTTPAVYTCTDPNPDGGRTCGAGVQTIECSSNASCEANQVCCRTTGGAAGTRYTCQDQCASGSLEITCGATTCSGNDVCCESVTLGPGGVATGVSGFECKGSCAQAEYLVCSNDNQCGQGTTCQVSNLLPALVDVCRP